MPANDKQFTDKVAIVTGAAMGIGQACARRFVAGGAKVICADIDDEAGRATVDQLAALGTAEFIHVDVASTSDVEAMADRAKQLWGGIDILVNNAARAIGGKVHETSEEDWQEVINTNLTSVWRSIKSCVPFMQGGGAIVTLSSVQALVGFAGWAAYATAKGGINALTQQAAIDLAPLKIRINAVAPGTIMTPLNEKVFAADPDPEGLKQRWNQAHPIGRFGEADEVAAAVAFLASDEASFITGEILRVDGGLVIRGE